MQFRLEKLVAIFTVFILTSFAFGQSRNNTRSTADLDGTILTVTASRADSKDPIKVENLFLYENGIEQKIKNFSYDPSPSKIVILIDNSQTLRADVESLKKATLEFAYEIFEGDQLFVVAYDENPKSSRNGRTTRKRWKLRSERCASREILIFSTL